MATYDYVMRRLPLFFALFLLVSIAAAQEQSSNRPDAWAQPMDVEGVPNLYKVNENLYRSAQPTAKGMQNLKKKGIETIINLRSFHSDRDEIGKTGLAYEHMYVKPWHAEKKEAIRFLQIVTNSRRTPVLVHCHHGSDRTGAMVALYRIAVQGWTKDKAIREMTEGGYGFHEIWDNLTEWIRELDIESVKKQAGISVRKDKTSEKERTDKKSAE